MRVVIVMEQGTLAASEKRPLLFGREMISNLCVDVGVVGVGLDEVAARAYLLAHEH